MSWYLSLPLIIPFIAAITAFLLRHSRLGRWVSIIGSGLGLIASIALMMVVLDAGVLAGQMGNWPSPFGITLVADLLSAVMVLITAITCKSFWIIAKRHVSRLRISISKQGWMSLLWLIR